MIFHYKTLINVNREDFSSESQLCRLVGQYHGAVYPIPDEDDDVLGRGFEVLLSSQYQFTLQKLELMFPDICFLNLTPIRARKNGQENSPELLAKDIVCSKGYYQLREQS